ncbi:OLC1v1006860C4 [Oldenlandia corymbosa var. corymbosa]|uniref:OLC1v1006860C4 n=1 Tax=Oldenlandia corymbosa var. corymbosa TaxID=529605 RepID=A0AAV1DIA8_OLDCO|nr:OLC1v1006860C4 [Oldenlandia corymbosa var. corymbosa]
MTRQATCCQSFLASILKFLNYLQTFMGVSIFIYSAFMLNHWHHHSSAPSVPPPRPQPLPAPPSPLYLHPSSIIRPNSKSFGDVTPLNLDLDLSLAAENVFSDVVLIDGVQFNFQSLPTPWFIYAFMGVGVMVCFINCIGHIAAEAMNGCCLCFHAVLTTLFVLLEITFIGFIAVDRQWEEDLPVDTTGELDRLRSFFEENREICEGVCIAVIVIQVLSLLLSIILRALVNQKAEFDEERAYDIRERPWEPLLRPNHSEASVSIRSDTRGGTHSDIWSSRMREKYGLNGGDYRQNSMNQSAAADHYPRH